MLIKKSITLKKHRTSLSLEIEFWEALSKIAEKKNLSIERLISEIDIKRKSSLASSTRVFILKYFE
ncbi:ribbon-helix-helix domain-containing protein [Pseudomonadota bacterium]|nr:ribbon-helix-helix domain-containing protein [Pseudomonadota bacterium]